MAIAGALLKGAKPIAKEAAEKVFKSLPDFIGKLGKVGAEVGASPQTMDGIGKHLASKTAKDLPKEMADIDTIFKSLGSDDVAIREAGYASLNELDNHIRPMFEKEAQADAIQKRVASYGSRAEGRQLKEQVGQDLIDKPDFEPRQDLWDITDTTGDAKRVSGTDKFLKHYQETGEIDPQLLVFQSRATNKASQAGRKAKMVAPEKETREYINSLFPNEPERAEKIADAYIKTHMKGYHGTAEAARRQGITTRQFIKELQTGKLTTKAEKEGQTQFASGHFRGVKAQDHPLKPRPNDSPLYNPSTDANSVQIENAIDNIRGSNKIEHDINPYAAEKAGIPWNWKEGIDLFIDRFTDTSPHKLPMWQRDFSVDELDTIMNIRWNASKEEVDKVFAAIMDARKNPNNKRQNFAQQLLELKRELGGEGDPLTGKTDEAPPDISDMIQRGLEQP